MSVDLLDSLLDNTVNELADLPVFKPKPAGTYKCQFSYETVTDGEVPYIKFTFKLLEVIQLDDPSKMEEIGELNDKSIVVINAFPIKKKEFARNEFGEGTIKMIVLALQETYGGSTNRETLDAANGSIVGITLKVRRSKNKETGEIQENNELVAIQAA